VPYDLLIDHCDIVIAVDVMSKREPGEDLIPSFTETVFNGLQIAERSILQQKFKLQQPDIFVDMEIHGVRVLDFHKSSLVYEQATPAVEFIRRELPKALELDRALYAQTRRPIRKFLRKIGGLFR
jgi:NTE family protein